MVDIPPEPINYLFVAGQPSDLNVDIPGFWTCQTDSFDSNYSTGAIQFHPIQTRNGSVSGKFTAGTLYEELNERWLHFTLKAFPFDFRERYPCKILEFCGYSLETAYLDKKKSELFLRKDSETIRKITEVSKADLNEYDIHSSESEVEVFLNGESVFKLNMECGLGDEIVFYSSKREMLWWSQIIVADRSTVGCKLSTIEPAERVDDNFTSWAGSVEDISGGEISDVNGITIKENGRVLFACNSVYAEERNFVDTVVLSARINNVKEVRDITAAYSQDDEEYSGDEYMNRNRYLENSQVTMRTNPIKNRRWWYSDLSDITLGLTAKPRGTEQ